MSLLFESFGFRQKYVQDGFYYDRWADGKLPDFVMVDRLYFLDQFLNSLLLHDKIYIRIDSLEELIDILGIDAVTKLIDDEILFIIDYWLAPWFMISADDSLMFMNMQVSDTHPKIIKRLKEKYTKSKSSYYEAIFENKLLNDNNEYSYWDWEAKNEMDLDFQNDLLRSHFNIQSNSAVNVTSEESFAVLKLFLMERSLEWARNLKTNVVVLEERAKYWLSLKAGHDLNREVIGNINKILSAKKIWNLSILYYNKVITIDDILKVRNDINGVKFREWILLNEYNPEELEKILMSHKGEDPIKKWLKWGIISLIGIVSAPVGLAASFANEIKGSYKDWTPDIYFDKTLSNKFSGKKVESRLLKK